MKTIDELNLIDWPLTVFGRDTESKSISFREYTILLRSKINHRQISGNLKIHSILVNNNSILEFYDEDVLLGLMQLMVAEYNNTNMVIIHNITAFCNSIGWSKGKYSNDKVIAAISRLTGLMFETDVWWYNEERRYITKGFHIIETYELRYSKTGKLSNIKVTWSNTMLGSLKSQNVRPLDFNKYLSLKLSGARKLYRVLDKRLYIKETGYIPFEYLSRVIFGISHTKTSAYCEKIIRKYADELILNKFLMKYKIEEYKGINSFIFRRPPT